MSAPASVDLAALLDSLPESAFIIDHNKRIAGMNRAAEVLTGISAAGAVGAACADIVRCSACGSACPFDEAVAGERSVSTPNIILDGIHGSQPIVLHTAPLRSSSGEIIGVLECARTIGNIVELVRALRESSAAAQLERNKVEAVLNSIAEGVLTIDRKRVVTGINHSGERILGRTEAESVTRSCYELVECRAESALACPATRVLAGGEAVTNFETEYADRSGKTIPVSVSIAPLRDKQGEIIGVVETFRDLRELMTEPAPAMSLVVGSARMHRIMELIDLLKDSDATVLLQGESGTGKGLAAETIHRLGNRARHPFVKVNCGALPEGLLESELFGHVKGAFTGAIRDSVGRFELADRGTLFLDEVGELSLATQVKLLRVLQDQEFERVGSMKTVHVDVRIIAATNRDLRQLMNEGRFRADLFYRLNVIPIELPPLRERREDIPALTEHILARIVGKGRKVKAVAPAVMETFLRYPWPGNIRELENTLEHAMVCSKGSVIEVAALPQAIVAQRFTTPSLRGRAANVDRTIEVLEQHHGNQSAAARALGINRVTLWRRIKKLRAHDEPLS